MDEEGGATVDLYILLKGSLLGDIFVAGLEPSIQHSEGLPHAVVDEELDDGPEHVVQQGITHRVPNFVVPGGVEVRQATREDSPQ